MASSNEVKSIRASLKKLGLSNRDVSVRETFGGFSSMIRIEIKNDKANELRTEIDSIAKSEEFYERDERTQEILSGGNTFITVSTSNDFQEELYQRTQNS